MGKMRYTAMLVAVLAGCNYGGPAQDLNCEADDYDPVMDGTYNQPLDDIIGDPETDRSEDYMPDDFAADPFAREQSFSLEPRSGIVPIQDEETGSVTLADHYAGHTTVRLAACLIVDNASIQRARIRIRFPDGTERIVTTAGSANDCRTPLLEVPLGDLIRVELADGCGPGGTLVTPFAGFYEESYGGDRVRRAFRFECYVAIGR